MVSSGVADTFGAIGGGVLAACLVPQLWKLYRTKSARDINMLFLCTYFLAMTASFLYLFFMDALVGWACIIPELICVGLMIVTKVYFDRWGPLAAHRVQHLTTSASFAKQVGLSVQEVSAAFDQLLRPAATHAAQHLLLDARLLLPPGADSAAAGAAAAATSSGAADEVGAAEKRSEDGSSISQSCMAPVAAAGSGDDSRSGSVLKEVEAMLEQALADAGLPALRCQAQAFPSFRRRQAADAAAGAAAAEEGSAAEEEAAAAADAAEAATAAAAPHMLFMACRGGYAAAVWHAPSSTLSLDLLAASDAAAGHMAQAAQALCAQLLAEWPGSRIEACSVARLPRPAKQQAEAAEEGAGEKREEKDE